MSNYVSSLISLAGNYQKAKDGNILRHASTVGHASKIVTKLASGQGTEATTKLCTALVDGFDKATKGSKIGQAVRTGVKLCRNTDPISEICAGIRVVKSDTPARALLEEGGDIAGMLIVEGAMIKHAKSIANIKGIKQANDAMVNFCNSKGGPFKVIPAIVYGVAFTVGSMAGSAAFRKAGTWVADKLGLAKSDPPDNHKNSEGKPQKYYFG
ncbi:hypothetical protein IJ843_05170 [bacterium]|nr:hypothetical protein [bacterium]